jgi:lipopolysaccharide/colanic/teichoic acid biosynthesis glycosyltransferase
VELTLALVLAVLTLPLLIGVAAASTLAYRTSPIFVHERVGRHGARFSFVKIRTLPPATGRYLDKHSIGTGNIPRVMQLVRRTHLDEIPQLWLVLTGHLSLVGPRPEMAVLHQRISARAAAERLSVRPGVTGLWQVSVHCNSLISDRVEYDRLYVRHRNLALDLWILARTAQKMAFGRMVHLFEVPRWAIGAERQPTIIDLTATALAASSTPKPLDLTSLDSEPQRALSGGA